MRNPSSAAISIRSAVSQRMRAISLFSKVAPDPYCIRATSAGWLFPAFQIGEPAFVNLSNSRQGTDVLRVALRFLGYFVDFLPYSVNCGVDIRSAVTQQFHR